MGKGRALQVSTSQPMRRVGAAVDQEDGTLDSNPPSIHNRAGNLALYWAAGLNNPAAACLVAIAG